MNELKPEDVMRALAWYEVVGKNTGSVTIPYNELQAIAAQFREKDAEIESLHHNLEVAIEMANLIRADVISEITERLKERMLEVYPADIYDSDIDQIANELKEEPYEQM